MRLILILILVLIFNVNYTFKLSEFYASSRYYSVNAEFVYDLFKFNCQKKLFNNLQIFESSGKSKKKI